MFDHIIFDKNAFDRKLLPSSDYIIRGYSGFQTECLVIIYLDIVFDDNYGDIGFYTELLLPLSIAMEGLSQFMVYKLGNVQVSFIHLENIQLLPGEEITIDMDLLIVLFGQIHDVSSITADSKFFQFGPGYNELEFHPEYDVVPRPGPDDELNVKVLWQNRWL